VLPADASEEQISLLRRECRNARRLAHPNIVRVFDFHRDPEVAFITMEAIEGSDIGVLRGVDLGRVLDAAVTIADALAQAHRLGVVHRDLKIANVLWNDATGPRLLDFGIADLLEGGADGLRLHGGGSPHTASPQQLAGEPASSADDAFALGKLLVELVSGRPARDAQEALRLLDTPAVPEALRELVGRLLAPTREARPDDLSTVRAELAAIRGTLGPTTLEATPPRDEVTLTAPPRATAIRSVGLAVPDVADRRRQTRAPRRFVWVLLSIAVPAALAAGIFLFLPRWSEAWRSRAVPPPPPELAAGPPTGPATSPQSGIAGADRDARERAEQRLRVADLAGRAGELLEGLEARGADLWGGAAHAAARSNLAEGAASVGAQDYARAESEFSAAIERLESVGARAGEAWEASLAEGRRALDAGDASAAEAAFRLAARIRPGDQAATRGLARARVLDEVVEQLAVALEAERRGELARAEERYSRAVALDSLTAAAEEGLERVRRRIADEAFEEAMSGGLAALEDGNYVAAREALGRAARLRPGSPEVAEALTQAREAVKLDALASNRILAEGLEQEERWREGADRYEAVLELDPSIAFAQNGRERCMMRADLAQRLEFHLTHPERLSDDAVLDEAAALLDEAREVEPAGPRHRDRIERLDRLLARASAPVEVVLESDEATEVTIYRVGRLGRFDRRTLSLRPGRYTVVGSRRGYRDVRHELVVVAGEPPQPLVVRCEEAI